MEKNEGIKPRHVWVDVEMLHMAADPDPELRGKRFNLDCLHLYIALCAYAMRYALRPYSSELLPVMSDRELLAAVGHDDLRGIKALGILKVRGLVRQWSSQRPSDISYATTDTRSEADRNKEESDSAQSLNRMHEEYSQAHGETDLSDFLDRVNALYRCDGRPRRHQNPKTTEIKGYVRLDWSALFAKHGGGAKDIAFSTLTPEEAFLLILLHQGTRPYLSGGVHPEYVRRKSDREVVLGRIVRHMCKAARFKTKPEIILQSLITKGMFAWVCVPLANQNVGRGGGIGDRPNTMTIAATYDSRHAHAKQVVLVAPTNGYHAASAESFIKSVAKGEIPVWAVDAEGVGQPYLGSYPLPAPPKECGASHE